MVDVFQWTGKMRELREPSKGSETEWLEVAPGLRLRVHQGSIGNWVFLNALCQSKLLTVEVLGWNY